MQIPKKYLLFTSKYGLGSTGGFVKRLGSQQQTEF